MNKPILIKLSETEVRAIIAAELRGTTHGRHRRLKRTLASDQEAKEADLLAGQIVAHMVKCGVVFMRGTPIGDGAPVMRGFAK